MNLNTKAKKQNTYDAIVVGSGISGGWAAKELTEKGLKTLVLERGYEIIHPNYPTANKAPWEFKYREKNLSQETLNTTKEKQKRIGYLREGALEMFVDDTEQPLPRRKKIRLVERLSHRWSLHYVGQAVLPIEPNGF